MSKTNTPTLYRSIEDDFSSLVSRLPEITLIDPKNITLEALGECEKELRLQMAQHIGQVRQIALLPIQSTRVSFQEMIFALAQCAQTFLDDHRTKRLIRAQLPPVIETIPENDVCR